MPQAHIVGQVEQRHHVLHIGTDLAFGPTPHRVAIGPDASADLTPILLIFLATDNYQMPYSMGVFAPYVGGHTPCQEAAEKRLEHLSCTRPATLDPARFGDSRPAPLATLRLLHLSRHTALEQAPMSTRKATVLRGPISLQLRSPLDSSGDLSILTTTAPPSSFTKSQTLTLRGDDP